MNPETWLLAHAQRRDELIARARDHRCFASLAGPPNRGTTGLRRTVATLIETAGLPWMQTRAPLPPFS